MSKFDGLNILLVDEHAPLLDSFRRYFIGKQCAFQFCDHDDTGLNHRHESSPPKNEDGLWLLSKLRTLHPDPPVAVVSGQNIELRINAVRVAHGNCCKVRWSRHVIGKLLNLKRNLVD